MNQEDYLESGQVFKALIVCDLSQISPICGFILQQPGLIVILETSLGKAMDRCSGEI